MRKFYLALFTAIIFAIGFVVPISAQLQPYLLNNPCPWCLPGATIDFDFVNGRFWNNGPVGINAISVTRALPAKYCDYQSGLWISVGANVLCYTDKGALIENSATNDALWARDLTNAVWIKVTMTTALNAVGIDGNSNSATTLTATSGNATVLQSITLGSQADTSSVFLKCVTCTGNIQITENNGSTWTTCSGLVTTGFTRCSVTATLANPIVGLRIVNNSDSVIADFFQMEPNGFASSPILTTNATATRSADNVSGNNPPTLGSIYTVFAQGTPISASDGNNHFLFLTSDNIGNNRFGVNRTGSSGANVIASSGGTGFNFGSGTWNQNIRGKIAASYIVNSQTMSFNGAAVVTNNSALVPSGNSNLKIGVNDTGGAPFYGYIERIALWPKTALSSSQLQAITQ